MDFCYHRISPSVIGLFLLTAWNFMAIHCQTDCPSDISTDGFMQLVNRFPNCRTSNNLNVFQDSAPIVITAYDDDDRFTGNVDYTDVDAFCVKAANCQNDVSSCQGELADFITDAGRALCQNGKAMSKEVKDAVDILKKDPCDFNKFDDLQVRSDGCLLGPDTASFGTYLSAVKRRAKVLAASERCSARFHVERGICSAEAAKSHSVLIAASQNLQYIGTSYTDYTDFKTPDVYGESVTLSLKGYSHVDVNGVKSSCRKPADNSLLLWNTYLRIDGTFMSKTPTSDLSFLQSVVIQFSSDDGVVLDHYMTGSSDKIGYETFNQKAETSTDIKISVKDPNYVILSHTVINAKIGIRKIGDSLTIVVQMPSNIFKSETLGMLADGCLPYSESALSIPETSSNQECSDNCKSTEPNKLECQHDCDNGLSNYQSVYESLKKLAEATKPDTHTSAANQVRVSAVFSVSLCTFLLGLPL